ncbi:MAG: hypothetical protein IKM28_02565 [Lachnospiraceae bacterium]|nr:hypothetical protein [Lachnospiraceae bacterium]
MKIQHNLAAMNANRNMKINLGTSVEATERLSSGYRVNRGADDAAGLSISEKMRRLIRGLGQASLNCQDGISLVQTAEGALHEVHDMLQRMNVLAVQSANGTNAKEERQALQQEFAHIQDEIDRVSETTKFNDMNLFTRQDGGTGTTNVIRTNYISQGNMLSVTGVGGADSLGSVRQIVNSQNVRAQTPSVQWGDYTITGGVENVDFRFSSTTMTILSSKHLTVSGTGTPSDTNRISVQSGVSANLTLNNIHIDASTSTGPAMRVYNNASLNLTLTGTNIIKGGANYAALAVTSGAKLVITEQSTGSLEAIGGACGAGIGGGNVSGMLSSGNITINGGTVTARGGRMASGIGGGNYGAGGNITINGGTIYAVAGNNAASIGGGDQGSGGNITITGGDVTALGSVNASDIGKGRNGDTGSFSTGSNGNAVITTNHNNISDTSNQSNWDAIIKNATTGTVYGNVKLTEDYTVEAGDTLNIADGAALTTPSGKVLTNEGTINNNGFMVNHGTLINNGTINGNAGSTLNNTGTLMNDGNITNNTDSSLENNGLVDNNGTLTNNGTVDNNPKGIIDNSAGGTIDNTKGLISNNDGKILGPIVGNPPVEGVNSLWLQAGADIGHGFNIRINVMNTGILGIKKNVVNILTQESSGSAITAISEAIGRLSEQRSKLGVYQNRLEHTIRNLDNVVENTTNMESRIRDADLAKETVRHSNNKIILQAAQAMLVQANRQSADILLLFNGR